MAVLVVGVLMAAWSIGRDGLWRGLVAAVVGLAVVAAYGWWSLRRGRHTPWAEAQTRIAPGHAVALWKPGCPYCERLLRTLGGDDRLTWVNVWHDDAANAVVRRLNDGDEYVPTLLIGEVVLRNPTADEVRAALG